MKAMKTTKITLTALVLILTFGCRNKRVAHWYVINKWHSTSSARIGSDDEWWVLLQGTDTVDTKTCTQYGLVDFIRWDTIKIGDEIIYENDNK